MPRGLPESRYRSPAEWYPHCSRAASALLLRVPRSTESSALCRVRTSDCVRCARRASHHDRSDGGIARVGLAARPSSAPENIRISREYGGAARAGRGGGRRALVRERHLPHESDDRSTTAPVETCLNCESCSSASRSAFNICWSVSAALSNSTG